MTGLLRIVLCLCGALIFVGAFATLGINAYFKAPPINQVVAFEIDAATDAELEAIRRLDQPPIEKPLPPPTLEVLQPQDGFVQIEFEVTPEGRAANARVIGAVPAGYYEQQALRRVEGRRYVPERIDGRAVSSVRTDIVEFTYPSASQSPAP